MQRAAAWHCWVVLLGRTAGLHCWVALLGLHTSPALPLTDHGSWAFPGWFDFKPRFKLRLFRSRVSCSTSWAITNARSPERSRKCRKSIRGKKSRADAFSRMNEWKWMTENFRRHLWLEKLSTSIESTKTNQKEKKTQIFYFFRRRPAGKKSRKRSLAEFSKLPKEKLN